MSRLPFLAPLAAELDVSAPPPRPAPAADAAARATSARVTGPVTYHTLNALLADEIARGRR